MKKAKRILAIVIVISVVIGALVTRQELSAADSQVTSAWDSVSNTYAERNDAVRAVLTTARAEPNFDPGALAALEQALAMAQAQPPSTLLIQDPQAFDKFKQGQAMLTGAMYRILAVSKQYPSVHDSTAMTVMQAYLDGSSTGGRLDQVRKHYSDAVAQYNALASSFPRSFFAIVLGFHTRPEFVHLAS